ncbi:MAG: pantoate--beta-alanine ligase [Vulcanibacillus sp.]
MIIFSKVSETKTYLKKQHLEGKSIGLVPTMGFLHLGHLSLISKAAKENDLVVVSIFVNPTQFGPNEDYERYPRNIERDLELSQEAGADIIFSPEVCEMYPENYNTYVEVKELTELLCGASRPGHFKGVTTIVTKLFNIILPNKAYFGQKDAQQCEVINKMVNDLNFDTEIIICPIIREKDGLALSSRNVYLSEEERKQAPIIYQALSAAKGKIEEGEKRAELIKKFIREKIIEKDLAKIEYIEIVDIEKLNRMEVIKGNILIAVAVKFGSTRLIDNILMEV